MAVRPSDVVTRVNGHPLEQPDQFLQAWQEARHRTELVVELGPGQDPAEWYAVVAVPSTVAVQQTEDVLSDYKGQLIYGQQATGAAKMQLLAVPFRGQRRLSLWLEAVAPGQSVGYVVARHVQRPDESAVVQLPEVRVVPGK